MELADIYYQAMLARDYRFDGKFFIGVKTTGIYCRPICPAKPKRENIEFFDNALSAEGHGYRPCMRCRPESAPLSPVWIGTSAIVRRALRVIASEGIEKEEAFAAKFGVSARHLRRLFIDEIGLTPKQVHDHHRLNFARKLVCETDLPLNTIALSSNFTSLRRFNDAFKKRFKIPPSSMRTSKAKPDSAIKIKLAYRPPFDWEYALKYLSSHLIEGIEEVEGDSYRRRFNLDGVTGIFIVRNLASENKLELEVDAENSSVLFLLARRVRTMFDLDSDPLLIASSFERDPLLKRLWQKYPGVRVIQAFDTYEMCISSILGQLVSVTQAKRLVASLIEHYGDAGHFPTAQTLSRAKLTKVGTTMKRKETIRAFSRLVARGELLLSQEQDMGAFREQMLSIPGIGPWTVEYIALRAMGDTDAFPGTDLILKRVSEKYSKLKIEKVHPWRSYAAMYLWREFAQSLSKAKK